MSDREVERLLSALGLGIAAARSEPLRAAWRKVGQNRIGMASATLLLLFTLVGFLDSLHYRPQLSARHPQCRFQFSALDIDHPFSVAPATYSLVYGVNVLHVARDLTATLGELRKALREDGMLVMAECVRPFPDAPLHLELVFNLLGSFRDAVLVPGWRPNGGFLTPEQWTAALTANGFTDVRIFPDIAAIRDAYPSFIVAAIVARRA